MLLSLAFLPEAFLPSSWRYHGGNDGWQKVGSIGSSDRHRETSFLKSVFAYFWLCWVFVAAPGLSLVVMNRGCSPAAVRGLPIAVASPVAVHGL